MRPKVLDRAVFFASMSLMTGSVMAELIVAPEIGGSRPSNASSQRERAGAYQNEAPVNTEDDDYGLLSPRGGAPVEDKAYENRVKAKAYQQSGEGIPQPLPAAVLGVEAAQPRSTEQRHRARAYTGSGNGQNIDLSHVGRDGIPLVNCSDVDNVSGRIGDDTHSGSVVHIIRQGRQIKVRCQ
ncbi:MAG: hypothetical protein PHV02_04285 [Rhodocyclaceae bacterium]|nr:hypothetical protein [Rhodocyclaceae bacterium]